MIINGTNFNSAAGIGLMRAAMQKKNGADGIPGLPFYKRFDTFELSDTLKKYADTKGNSTDIAEIRKMLSDANIRDESDTLLGGLTGLASMEMTYMISSMRINMQRGAFCAYKEEKTYYQNLLSENTAKSDLADHDMLDLRFYENYEYQYNGGDIDKEKVEQALANVQDRIDKLIAEASEGMSKRFTEDMFNDCVNKISSAFGSDEDGSVLGGYGYDDLFGKMDMTEENFYQMLDKREENLHKAFKALENTFSRWLDNIRKQDGGAERVQTILKALHKVYGSSYDDLLGLLESLNQDGQENAEAE